MKYEKFLKIIKTIEKQEDSIKNLRENGILVNSFTEHYETVIEELIQEIYGKEGLAKILWFCYDNNFGKNYLFENDEKGFPICHTHIALWEYLEKRCKKNK